MSFLKARPSGRITERELTRRIAALFRPYRGQVILVAMAIVVTSLLGIANPILIKVIFDRALFCRNGCPQIPLLVQLVALMVIIPVISGVIGLGQTYLTTRVGQRVMQDLRDAVYGHLQQMSLRFFTNTRTGEIQSRLTNDIAGVQQVVTNTTSDVLSNVVSVMSTIIAMFILSWQLTVITLSVVPFFLYFTNRAGKARRAVTMQAQEAKAHMTAVTEETLSVSGILLAKVFGRQRDELRRFQQENQKLADLAIRREMVGRVLSTVIHAAFSTSPAFVYLLAGFVIGRGGGGGALTAGTIVAFTTLQTRMFFPISRSLDTAVEALASLALFERIFDYLELHRDITEPSKPVRLDPATVKGSVRFANVSFRYDTAEVPISTNGDGATPPRTWALENVSFEVKPGQLAAIVGPSGAGKTTISYLVPRLYDVTKGAVLIDGIDVRELDFKSLSDVVGMVTQETYLFHASVRRNILYGRPDAGEEEVEEAARAAFIHDRIMELAEGYDTTVGERGYRMSGGEKQRIAIARLLLKAPRVLILDEATSALDTTSERLVQAALRRLEAGRTTIAIAHRLSTILAADVIFVLDRGRIIERGTHDELVRRGGLYARLYEQQFKSGKVEALCDDGVVLAGGEVVTEKTA